MPITDLTYYKAELLIPNSQTSVSDTATGVRVGLNQFISQYEREALVKTLGYTLYTEFAAEFDIVAETDVWTIKAAAAQKWKDLLNGLEYEINGDTVNYRGMIFTEPYSGDDLNRSFIAYYIYYHYLNDDMEDYAGTGISELAAKNATRTSPIPKSIRSWRRFYELVVGTFNQPALLQNRSGMIGLDWFGSVDTERSLYQFIDDQNTLVADTYENWEPTQFDNENQFGI
jgi:hypothetical protein